MNNSKSVLNSQDSLLPELETHRGKVDVMNSELLRVFSSEYYAHVQDFTSSFRSTCQTINTDTHFHPELSEAASKLCNAVTRLRHERR